MGYQDITPAEPWDIVQTIKEAGDLEKQILRFMEHTLHALSQPCHIITPFGESVIADEVEHPLGDALGRIRAVREGCYKQYGKDMWEQSALFEDNLEWTIHGRTSEAGSGRQQEPEPQ